VVVELYDTRTLGYLLIIGELCPEEHRRTVPQGPNEPWDEHEKNSTVGVEVDPVGDGQRDAAEPVEADEGHAPGGGERYDVVEEQERETPHPGQLPAALEEVGGVDDDE